MPSKIARPMTRTISPSIISVVVIEVDVED
jgi:hypothetical protein